MSVTDGQAASAAVFNAAFVSRTADTTAAGVVSLTKTTDSSSTTTGALKVAGGLGLVKNLWVGGTGNVAGILTLQEKIQLPIEDSASSGTNLTLALPKFSMRLPTGIVSIVGVTAPTACTPIVLINDSGSTITIKNDVTATAANRILTGTSADLSLLSGASLLLVYDLTETRWRVVGGTATVAAVGTSTYTKTLISGSYTALNTDDGIVYTGSGGHTITMYAASAQQRALDIVNLGTGNVTIARAGSDTILEETSQVLPPYGGLRLLSDGSSKFGST